MSSPTAAAGTPWATPYEDFVGVEVAPGVRCTAMPFPSPLRSSFSYVIGTDGGVLVVDLGWDTDEGWTRFVDGLARAGAAPSDVVGVVLTHLHPDHHGLAERLRACSPAWLAVHPAERPALARDAAAAVSRIGQMADWLHRCGAPGDEIETLLSETDEIAAGFLRREPDLDLVDGEPVPGTGGALVAVHTPGHTPGHLCLHDRSRGVVLTGDHVLPRITPNVSKRPTSDPDPLDDYATSLHRLGRLDGVGEVQVLPGHEWGFAGLPARLSALEGHHAQRLEEMEAAVRAGAGTVWEVAQVVPWSRPFGALGSRARRSAVGETHSHLFHLHTTGRLRLAEGEPDRWSPPADRHREER